MAEKSEQLQAVAAKIGIGAIHRHVFLCTGPKCCTPEVGQAAWETLKQKLKDVGLSTGDSVCQRTRAGCLRICCQGPTVLVYPEGTWYHGMTEDKIERFVQEHLIAGKPIDEWIFAQSAAASAGLSAQDFRQKIANSCKYSAKPNEKHSWEG